MEAYLVVSFQLFSMSNVFPNQWVMYFQVEVLPGFIVTLTQCCKRDMKDPFAQKRLLTACHTFIKSFELKKACTLIQTGHLRKYRFTLRCSKGNMHMPIILGVRKPQYKHIVSFWSVTFTWRVGSRWEHPFYTKTDWNVFTNILDFYMSFKTKQGISHNCFVFFLR